MTPYLDEKAPAPLAGTNGSGVLVGTGEEVGGGRSAVGCGVSVGVGTFVRNGVASVMVVAVAAGDSGATGVAPGVDVASGLLTEAVGDVDGVGVGVDVA